MINNQNTHSIISTVSYIKNLPLKFEIYHALLHYLNNKWRPPSISELSLMKFDMEITHLGSKASKNITQSQNGCVVRGI